MTDDTRLERAIEDLLFSKIASGRLVGYTVTVAHEIMGLVRNIGIPGAAQPTGNYLHDLADYLDRLEAQMLEQDLDMMVEEMTPPSVWADRIRAALASQPPAAPVKTIDPGPRLDKAMEAFFDAPGGNVGGVQAAISAYLEADPAETFPRWCPGCSRNVDEVCHHFNCAIGPNGLDAQLRPSAGRETVAKIIYDAFPFMPHGKSEKPDWVPGGNSIRQDDARRAADRILALPQSSQETVGYQRRNIGPDGTPWSTWYPAGDEPTPENMKFDGYLSYEYRPLYAGSPLPRPEFGGSK